jgi:Amt family ammonium transporter
MELEKIISEYTGFWMLICLALVFFMQGGFAMVETGLTRAKNAGNIIMKNLMDFCIGTVAFLLLGYSLLCGDSIGGFVGSFVNTFANFGTLNWTGFFFNLVFCATAATIVSGAMAERTKFVAYCLYSLIISLVVYPIEAHWIWNGGGWLYNMGYIDFAGSSAVHMVGGVAALVGAKILGPRIGKYTENDDGSTKVNAIPGHSLTLAALGVFILWFCWYGFNGAAAGNTTQAAQILCTTTIAAAVASCATMLFTWFKNGKPDVSMTLNGALAGLVGITAGCANVDAIGATVIGIVCGIAVVVAVEFFDQKVKIDDPVGAISVHGVCGALGTVMVGLLDYTNGLFYGGGAHLLFVQVTGVVSVIVWVTVTMIITFAVINKTIGLRVTEREELEGLDSSEHNLASSYADFVCVGASDLTLSGTSVITHPVETAVPVAVAAEPSTIRVVEETDKHSKAKFTKVQILTNPGRFDALKTEMEKIEVTGMTVTQVLGCGTQKGRSMYYRGVEVGMQLLPKIQVDIVVTKVPVAEVVAAARKALYTGSIGDGKIFIYNVEDVIRIRTGETGYDALQIEGC